MTKLKLIKGMRLVAATHNPGKAREIAALLDGNYVVVTAGEAGVRAEGAPCGRGLGRGVSGR